MKISRRARLVCGFRTGHIIAAIISVLLVATWLLWPGVATADNATRFTSPNAQFCWGEIKEEVSP